MRILIVDTYYPAFLDSVYADHPKLHRQSYSAQWRALMDCCFGTSDFYSKNLTTLGVEAREIVFNCMPLQRAWCRESGFNFPDSGKFDIVDRFRRLRGSPGRCMTAVFTEQVRRYRPDILYIQDMIAVPPVILRRVRPFVRRIVGQIASKLPRKADFREYDLILSSLPHFVHRFRSMGLTSHYFRLGFEATILDRLSRRREMDIPICHIGGYGPIHAPRNRLLESLLADNLPLACWGYGISRAGKDSPLKTAYRGEAWGLDMYAIRGRSRLVVSKHIPEVADGYANIMTLYEATGVGAALVIDRRKDLESVFVPGEEVIVYDDAKMCSERIAYYLAHEEERKSIAAAGQRRTLREHTYAHRMAELVSLLNPLLA